MNIEEKTNGYKKSSKIIKFGIGFTVGFIFGHNVYSRNVVNDPDLQFRISAIGTKYGISVEGVKISFDYFPTNTIARAYTGLDVIKVDKYFWEIMSEDDREATLLHELAHLNFVFHDDREDLDKCPISIMHSHAFPECLEGNVWKYKLQFMTEVLPKIRANGQSLKAKVKKVHLGVIDFILQLF
jgi:hypothetical protein